MFVIYNKTNLAIYKEFQNKEHCLREVNYDTNAILKSVILITSNNISENTCTVSLHLQKQQTEP